MPEIKRVAPGMAKELAQGIKSRRTAASAAINAAAAGIMEDVRLRGYDAVKEWSLKLDEAAPREITREELTAAAERCPQELLSAMERAADNIRDYQMRLLPVSSQWHVGRSSRLGQVVRGLERVGVYVPGGRAAYPSSVLMNIIPARVAGVKEIVMVTPPTSNMNDAVLAAALTAGADRVFAVGGVQAVAALVYGAGPIPAVDKIVGPGNAYVAAAKRMAYGHIDIDMVAGPSEVLVIADESADPEYAAADMLSQAEHDVMASAILIATSQEIAERTRAALLRRLEKLDRSEIARRSIDDYGAIFVDESIESACELANEVAPEHLELLVRDAGRYLPLIRNAGAVFIGENSPEPLGDYLAGPSHVLPTSGTARFFSPLSVDSFLKKMSVIDYSRDDLKDVSRDVVVFAEAEGLTAHAESIRVRFEKGKGL